MNLIKLTKDGLLSALSLERGTLPIFQLTAADGGPIRIAAADVDLTTDDLRLLAQTLSDTADLIDYEAEVALELDAKEEAAAAPPQDIDEDE